MNRIQAISIELKTRERREALGLAPDDGRSSEAVRRLWHESRLERLKRKLQRQFSSPAKPA